MKLKRRLVLFYKEGAALTRDKAKKDKLQQNTTKWWRENTSWLFITGIVLLVSAGEVAWAAAWVYLAAIVLIVLINAFKMDPELMAERAGLQEGTARWDLYLSVFVALAGPLLTIPGQ